MHLRFRLRLPGGVDLHAGLLLRGLSLGAHRPVRALRGPGVRHPVGLA